MVMIPPLRRQTHEWVYRDLWKQVAKAPPVLGGSLARLPCEASRGPWMGLGI